MSSCCHRRVTRALDRVAELAGIRTAGLDLHRERGQINPYQCGMVDGFEGPRDGPGTTGASHVADLEDDHEASVIEAVDVFDIATR